MEQILNNLYGLEFTKGAIADFNRSLKMDDENSNNSFNQILIDVTEICQNDFESASELNSHVSKVVSNMYELNDKLIFNDPVKNHIPVLTALVKSVMCYSLGDFSSNVQKNEKSAAQLYGLAFDHLLKGKTILSFSDINSELFDTFEPVILNKFMDSYSKFVGISHAHSIIALKHYLMTETEKTTDWYSSELLTSMGHGFYSILSNLDDISPQDDWMPFTSNYFLQKCVEAHEQALKCDINNGQDYKNSGDYYLQSSKLFMDKHLASNNKLFNVFSDHGLYELANSAAKMLETASSGYRENIKNISNYRGFEENINTFNEKYDSLIKDLKNKSDTFSGCSNILSEILIGDYQNMGPINDNQFIHNIFYDLLNTLPENINDADRTMMLKMFIDGVLSLHSFEEKSTLIDVFAGIENKNKFSTTEKDIKKVLNNAKKLDSMGLSLFGTDDNKVAPDIENLSIFNNFYFDTLKKTLDSRVAQLQFLLELSKVLKLEYDRRELVTFRGLRSLLSISDKDKLINTVFDGVDDYIPIALTLRFKMLETISKAIYQLSPYENSSFTVDKLLSKLRKMESKNVVFGARDEAHIYEYSESSKVLTKFISEVMSSVASGKAKAINEYNGYGFIDSNYGWETLLDRAESFNKAAIIHNNATMILNETGDDKMASQAQETSRECEGKALLLAAFYYESKKNKSQKADDLYTQAIAAFTDAGIANVVEAITTRKFWFREQNNSHSGIQ